MLTTEAAMELAAALREHAEALRDHAEALRENSDALLAGEAEPEKEALD
jgi:hypothetical protein